MISLLEHRLPSTKEDALCGCGTAIVHTLDAIGRTRARCPKCDRVAPIQHRQPDEVMIPQGLIRLSDIKLLPEVEDGQLRCQRCARGVDGDVRFCASCQAQRDEASRPQTICKGCGRVRARERFEKTVTKKCEQCYSASLKASRPKRDPNAPKPERPTTRACPGCGGPVPVKRGRPRSSCENCPPIEGLR